MRKRKSYTVVYTEVTADRGYLKKSAASDNWSEYRTTSAYMHDAINDFVHTHDRLPSSSWYRRQCRWEKKRLYN